MNDVKLVTANTLLLKLVAEAANSKRLTLDEVALIGEFMGELLAVYEVAMRIVREAEAKVKTTVH